MANSTMAKLKAHDALQKTSPDQQFRDALIGLVNPSTGLANDYLNVFNEILLLIEFLPTMPEMTDEALAWRPRGYLEYFEQSPLPGAQQVMQAYAGVDPEVRAHFETILARLTDTVTEALEKVSAEQTSPHYPETIVNSCEDTALAMRAHLDLIMLLINEGRIAADAIAAHFGKLNQDGI